MGLDKHSLPKVVMPERDDGRFAHTACTTLRLRGRRASQMVSPVTRKASGASPATVMMARPAVPKASRNVNHRGMRA